MAWKWNDWLGLVGHNDLVQCFRIFKLTINIRTSEIWGDFLQAVSKLDIDISSKYEFHLMTLSIQDDDVRHWEQKLLKLTCISQSWRTAGRWAGPPYSPHTSNLLKLFKSIIFNRNDKWKLIASSSSLKNCTSCDTKIELESYFIRLLRGVPLIICTFPY